MQGSLDMNVPAPVIIGNIPLRSEWSNISAAVPPAGAMQPATGPPADYDSMNPAQPGSYATNFNTEYGAGATATPPLP